MTPQDPYPGQRYRLIDTPAASYKGDYVNRVADALLKATRISIGGGLRRDAFGDLVSILHVSADCAEGGRRHHLNKVAQETWSRFLMRLQAMVGCGPLRTLRAEPCPRDPGLS